MAKKKDEGFSSTLESYLEEINSLQKKYGAVRATDLAQRMQCATPSATNALRRLANLDLINYEAYRPVTLTDKGKAAIKKLDRTHRILAEFMTDLLALPSEIAEKEACRLEHRISQRVLSRINLLMQFLKADENSIKCLSEQKNRFERFLDENQVLSKDA